MCFVISNFQLLNLFHCHLFWAHDLKLLCRVSFLILFVVFFCKKILLVLLHHVLSCVIGTIVTSFKLVLWSFCIIFHLLHFFLVLLMVFFCKNTLLVLFCYVFSYVAKTSIASFEFMLWSFVLCLVWWNYFLVL